MPTAMVLLIWPILHPKVEKSRPSSNTPKKKIPDEEVCQKTFHCKTCNCFFSTLPGFSFSCTATPPPPSSSSSFFCLSLKLLEGYLNDENETSSTIDKDGWLRTGDITYFDQDGYLYVLDRLKDTIKYKGFQIAPADLEGLLICHPKILDVAVTFAEDEEAGEIPVAFVVRVPGSSLSSSEVIQYVAKQVAPYKKVRRVVFVDSIPKSAAGKILRRLLRSNSAVSRM